MRNPDPSAVFFPALFSGIGESPLRLDSDRERKAYARRISEQALLTPAP